MNILADTPDKLGNALKGVDKIASGTIPHIAPFIITKDELEELKSAYESGKEKAKNSDKLGDVNKAIYTTACYRDAVYVTRGRKFMRTSGLNGKARAAWGRAECLNWMKGE